MTEEQLKMLIDEMYWLAKRIENAYRYRENELNGKIQEEYDNVKGFIYNHEDINY